MEGKCTDLMVRGERVKTERRSVTPLLDLFPYII